MRARYHVAVSALVAAVLAATLRSWAVVLGSFLMGVFMDLDHLYDYFAHRGLRFEVQDFFRSSYERKYSRAYLMLHGWEWFVVWVLACVLSGWNPWLLGLLIGFSQHLIFDQIANKPHPWGYSLFWRWRYGFLFNEVFPRRRSPHRPD